MRTEPQRIPTESAAFVRRKQQRAVVSLTIGASLWSVLVSSPSLAQRVRTSINDGWKFHRGDPPAGTADLRYEVLPELKLRPYGADFDAGVMDDSDTVVRKGVLRPYILPSENAFIRDPARRHHRPPGNPGGDVPYVGSRFDDAGWTSVSLPHDWAGVATRTSSPLRKRSGWQFEHAWGRPFGRRYRCGGRCGSAHCRGGRPVDLA